MGSGELTKSMAPTHRALLAELSQTGTVRAVFLDTPAAFEENVDQLADRAVSYFDDTLGVKLGVVRWRDYADPGRRPRFLTDLTDANYVFAGPGSPSFALRMWHGTEVPSVLRGLVRRGGCLVFASAAALTLGAFAIPVYEIFKVGEELHWLPGLDLLSETGLQVAVVPHYDNRAGKQFDTRFCYLGERRFLEMERLLPSGVAVLGVDEHTACIVDRLRSTITVRGRGAVTFGRGPRRRRLTAGESAGLGELTRGPEGTPASQSPAVAEVSGQDDAREPDGRPAPGAPVDSLVESALRLVRELEASGSQDPGRRGAREPLEQTILRLGDRARTYEGTFENQVRPLVESLMELRDRARNESDWALADAIRDQLKRAGVEVRDKGPRSEWLVE